MQDKVPLISIVIPVKNGLKTLKNCIDTILGQTMIDQTELIIIDSGSTDGSLELIREYPNIRLIEIPPEDFSHGGTRNLGVQMSNGEFVVMTVQDAVPDNEKWLEIMLQHFQDQEVAGVCGMQYVPHDPRCNPLEWFQPVSKPQTRFVQYKNATEFEVLSPQEKRHACRLDDVNCMYRKSALKEHPFKEVLFGEDMLWAMEILKVGGRLVFEPRAKVKHYHHGTYDYTYKRTLTDWYFTYKYFGFNSSYKISLFHYFKLFLYVFKYKISPRWLLFNINKSLAIDKAYKDFNRMVKNGDDHLDTFYSNVCWSIPQGKI